MEINPKSSDRMGASRKKMEGLAQEEMDWLYKRIRATVEKCNVSIRPYMQARARVDSQLEKSSSSSTG